MARITVEDCLKREPNRFALVLLAAKRAKELLAGAPVLTRVGENKSIVSALREVADDKVRFMTAEDIAREEERIRLENEKRAAEHSETNGVHENGALNGITFEKIVAKSDDDSSEEDEAADATKLDEDKPDKEQD